MNIENLEIKTYKNYKELCGALGWEVSAGNTKKKQFKELDTLCEYHKEGQKIIIDNVFDKQKERVDMRKYNHGNSADYISDLELRIIGELLTKGSENNLVIGKSVLLRDVGLVNWNYSFCKRRQDKLANYLDIDKETIYDYYNSVDGMVVNNLEKAMKNLKNEKIIDADTTTIICKNIVLGIEYEHKIIIDEYDEEIDRITPKVAYDVEYVEATQEEKNVILECEGKVLDDMNVKTINNIFAMGRMKEYYDKCYKRIRKIYPDFNYYFKAYNITYNYNRIVNKLNEYGYEDWLKDLEDNCNKVINLGVKDKIIINAKNRKKRKDKEYEKSFGINPNEKHKCRLSKDYINKYNKINNNIIDIGAKNIKVDVAKTKIEQN